MNLIPPTQTEEVHAVAHPHQSEPLPVVQLPLQLKGQFPNLNLLEEMIVEPNQEQSSIGPLDSLRRNLICVHIQGNSNNLNRNLRSQ